MPSRLTVLLLSFLLSAPVLMYWLWLVLLPARIAILCPEGCHCDELGGRVFCYGTSLNSVPFIHFTNVQILKFFESSITLLRKDTFVSLTELEELFVNKCGLRTINLEAFNGLTILKRLFLMDNEVNELLPGTFQNLRSLESLNLSSNRLEHLNSSVFSGLVNLKDIDLSGNKLQYLHPDTFLGLPNLQQLYLAENWDLHIPTDNNFIISHSLSHLVISRCNVSSLSVETLANITALEWIDLSDNNLRTVDINILIALPKLSTVYLYGNPLASDGQLQEVWRLCKDCNIQTGCYGTASECGTSSGVKGMLWVFLKKGRCFKGNTQYCGDYKNTSCSDTGQKYDYGFELMKQYELPFYGFHFIFGTISNVILLIIIICNKDMRTVPNMYILNLAISDIIFLTLLFSIACANRILDTWLYVGFLCRFLPFCRRMTGALSAYSVAVYSFQRYRVTANPLQVLVSSQANWCVTVATVCGVWIVAALFAVPSALSKVMCKGINVISISYYRRVVLFQLLVYCVLPLCVIVFSYVMIARHLVKSSSPISDGTQNSQLETRRNSAKIVMGLTVVFLISYVPYHVLWTCMIWTQKPEYPFRESILYHLSLNYEILYIFSNCSLLINSCLNPLALFCISSPFKQHLKRYLTRFCKTNSTPTDFELTRRN
jgi:hypothetical protein